MITPAFAVVLLFLTPNVTGYRVDPPHTVTELDFSKYVGKWYQMYTNKRASDLFEKGGECITSSYNLGAEGAITEESTERLNSPTGPKKVIHGNVRTTSVVGQFEVNLDNVPYPVPYWVIKLGPETFGPDKFYEYSVITDNLKGTLFVLARNTTDFKDNYKEDVLKFVQDEGFVLDDNRPVETYQGSDCLYSDANAMKANEYIKQPVMALHPTPSLWSVL